MILTIGHSTRSLDELVALLHAHRVTQLADVRTVPKSRRHPQFSRESLEHSLPDAGIVYRHCPGLGGLRKPRKNSTNSAWRNDSFRGYADYMQTPAFEQALADLIAWGRGEIHTAIMCAEAVWWRCHRQLIADALLARGVAVAHIISAGPAEPHRLTEFARIDAAGRVTYPGLLDGGGTRPTEDPGC